MAAIQQTYEYSFEMNYVLDSKDYQLPSQIIKYAMIDYDYDNNIMPIIYMSLALKKSVFDKMNNNVDKGYVSLIIRKRQSNASRPLWTKYIEGQFNYFILSENPETTVAPTVGEDKNQPYDGDDFKSMEIALLKTDIVNKTKKTYNTVLNGINLMDAAHYGTAHLPMVIEPIKGGRFSNLIIPPIDSTSKYLKYINSVEELYDTPYRFFVDFNRGYLLSSSGKAVPVKGDKANSIIVKEEKTDDLSNKFSGQEYDDKQKCYTIRLSKNEITENKNNISNKSVNKVVGISSSGKKVSSKLNTIKDNFGTEKTTFIRVRNENMKSVKNKAKSMENQTLIIGFAKSEIDTSIFTPNMEYNYKSLEVSQYNGRYLLSKKQEIFKQMDGEFTVDVHISLKKIMST